MNRRHFLRNSALGVAGAGFFSAANLRLTGEDAVVPTPTIKSYRTLGRTEFKVSDISSGAPMNVAVLNAMLDAGVNYIDTAEGYGRGKSELAVGEAIKNRDRKKLFITSKLYIKETDTKETLLTRAHKCLERLNTEYIDCMMMHCPPVSALVKHEPFHEAMKQLKTEGKLRFTGISNHGPENEKQEPMDKVLLGAVADGRFDVMLFVYSFAQSAQSEVILKSCYDKNIGVTLMKTNPVSGYMAVKADVEALQKEGKEVPVGMAQEFALMKAQADLAESFLKKYNLTNPAEIRSAATRFVLAHPVVATVCCSINSFEDMESFLKLSGQKFTSADEKKLSLYREASGSFYCRHACGICHTACPHQVPVNTIMRFNHYFEAQGREKEAMLQYAQLTSTKADKCFECSGFCQVACPYGVKIHGLLALAHQRLTLA